MKTLEQSINERIEFLDENIAKLRNLAWELYEKRENDSNADDYWKFWEDCDKLSIEFDRLAGYFQNVIDKPF